MINEGVKVLMIVNLDSASGAAVETKAKTAGVKTIDYDRLTLGGSADYYVSFDNVKVGELQGSTLVKCLTGKGKTDARIVELNGSPTDNNATLFKQGYDSELNPKYAAGWTEGRRPDRAELGQHPGRHDLRADAHRGRQQDRRRRSSPTTASANAVITVLKKNGLTARSR